MLRLVLLVVGLALGIFFVLRYADRVKADPSRSVVAEMREENARHFSVQAAEGEEVGDDRAPEGDPRWCSRRPSW